MKISLSNQEEGHTILCLARYVGGVGTKSKIFFVMQFYDEVFAKTVLNLTLKDISKLKKSENFKKMLESAFEYETFNEIFVMTNMYFLMIKGFDKKPSLH